MTDEFFQSIQGDVVDIINSAVSNDPALLALSGPGGWPAIHLAAYFGSIKSLKALLAAGANIELRSQNDNANTPLHAAVAGGQLESVRELVSAGADIQATYYHGTTVLHEAAFINRKDLVELLISLGAKTHARNERNETAADIARQKGHTQIIELLENK